jgi:DNA helicase HerA-like ATPase
MSETLLIGAAGDRRIGLLPALANRHGLIAGATGTGKTVTLQRLAEGFSRLGVPVFATDIKGDLSGIGAPGSPHPRIEERVRRIGLEDFAFEASPVVFWDVFGEQGHPVRTTVSEMGPLMLARLLGLNETQEGVLSVLFRVADENGWLVLDLKDLRAMLQFVADNARELRTRYGNVSHASVGAIQRRLLTLESQGGDRLFGEPALDIGHLMQTDGTGRGVVNLLAADRLMQQPQAYGALLLWLLSELFERLPEVGDPPKPRLVLFFDEAHLLFEDAPDALLDKIEQVVRLIRSKGVGVYFVTQNPTDIPEPVLAQLGNRIQHALRAYTPREQKAVRVAARSFRPNPALDTERVITELGVGEALVSVLDEAGRPTPVERTLIAPPRGRIGPLSAEERTERIRRSPLSGVYEKAVDRRSAYEILAERAAQAARDDGAPAAAKARKPARRGDSAFEAMLKSAARSLGTQLGRELMRGLLGSLLGRRR